MTERQGLALTITDFEEGQPHPHGYRPIGIQTTLGKVRTRLYPGIETFGAAVFLGAASSGFDSPARDLFHDLAIEIRELGVASLHVRYRLHGEVDQCTLDALAGIAYLGTIGIDKVVTIGHGFGGAIAINAGALSPAVRGVAALSTQSYATDRVPLLAPRPLLLFHGESDTFMPTDSALTVFHRARQPKEMVTFPSADHHLEEAREEIMERLREWIPETLQS